jgi:hypothetical protein
MRNYLIISLIALSLLISGCAPSTTPASNIVGGDLDEHGCKPSAGYSWCDPLQKCLRVWEEACIAKGSIMDQTTAWQLAENSDCTEKGDLAGTGTYNPNSKTWWIDLDMRPEFRKDSCNPACVIFEETRKIELNWRCTGALPPE